MNRNLKTLLCVLLVTLIAALTGCGGGDPKSMSTIPVDPTNDADMPDQQVPPNEAGVDVNAPDTSCTMSLGGSCAPDGITDPCTGFECMCGKWDDPESPISTAPCVQEDAGTDSPDDVVEPDADADVPDVVTPEEICGNGLDDDHNGKADCQDDACANETVCKTEVCNGADDNGNGQVDEGFECKLGATAQCQASCGSIGTMNCISGCTWSACTPPAEVCGNGIDDNCNGAADCDDIACQNEFECQCDAPTVGSPCGFAGEFSCDTDIRCDCAFTWSLASSGNFSCIVTESCNGLDDNGNGLVDESFPCAKSTSQNCVTSCGSTGFQTCGATCEFGTCAPPLESCGNGVDDDCDGKTDCADSDCSGLLACQTEICDGADNNGNGLTDEGYACIAGSTGSCTTSCGSAGMYQCSSTCTKGACIAFENCYAQGDEDCDGKADCADTDCVNLPVCNVATEVCNGLDDNNNGQVDEIFQCVQGSAPVSCTTSCGSASTKACLSNCSYGTCTPPSENCTNGVDDDCDGKADCADTDCQSLPQCQTPTEICNNAIDDDGDSLMDGEDPDCNHDYGTCPSTSPTPGTQNCDTPVQELAPDGMSIALGLDAYSSDQQLLVGTNNWYGGKIYSRQGGVWVNVSIPVTTKAVMSVKFVGNNRAFATAITDSDSYLLRWDGTSISVAAHQPGTEFNSIWGNSENNVWMYGQRDLDSMTGSAMYHWNGTTLIEHELPAFYAPSAFQGRAITGAGDGLYLVGGIFDPTDRNNYDKMFGAMMHFDGTSWAPIAVDSGVRFLDGVNATDACGVTAVGGRVEGSTSIGATFTRNGSTWSPSYYNQVSGMKSVVKLSQGKEIVLGTVDGVPPITKFGTTNDSDYSWSNSFGYLSTGSQFYYSGPMAKIPGTNTVMISGDGHHGANDPAGYGDYVFIFRSTCQ